MPSNFADRNGQFDTDWDASDSEDPWDSFEGYCACYEEYAIEKLSDDYDPIPDFNLLFGPTGGPSLVLDKTKRG